MKKCFRCGALFQSKAWRCPSCASAPPMLDGFPSFAPELAHGGAGFDESLFDMLVNLEERNFWFEARTNLILDVLRRFAPAARFMIDAGCGTGVILQAIRSRTDLDLTGADPFVRGLEWARKRVPQAELIQSDLQSLPFDGAFDIAGAFDVLEHIEDDVGAMAGICRTLKPGGILIATAPQHPRLWSAADEFAHHERRYTRKEMTRKLESAGLRVRFVTSFVSLLLPAMFVARMRRKARAELSLSSFVNGALRRVMSVERAMIASGVRFPAGGSLLVVAER